MEAWATYDVILFLFFRFPCFGLHHIWRSTKRKCDITFVGNNRTRPSSLVHVANYDGVLLLTSNICLKRNSLLSILIAQQLNSNIRQWPYIRLMGVNPNSLNAFAKVIRAALIICNRGKARSLGIPCTCNLPYHAAFVYRASWSRWLTSTWS